jgi:hypothetical protein
MKNMIICIKNMYYNLPFHRRTNETMRHRYMFKIGERRPTEHPDLEVSLVMENWVGAGVTGGTQYLRFPSFGAYV